jgi:uncharacterized protein YjiS (DUF1127 family)
MSACTQPSLTNYRVSRPSLLARLTSLTGSMRRVLALWRSRVRERHAFPVLNDRDLSDLRMSRWQIERELAKPFWRG